MIKTEQVIYHMLCTWKAQDNHLNQLKYYEQLHNKEKSHRSNQESIAQWQFRFRTVRGRKK